MAISQGFYPQGLTQLVGLTGATAASSAIQISTAGIQGARLANLSTGNFFVAIGATTATAVLPLSSIGSTAVTSFPLRYNSEMYITTPPNAWISAISTATAVTGLLAVTPGIGNY